MAVLLRLFSVLVFSTTLQSAKGGIASDMEKHLKEADMDGDNLLNLEEFVDFLRDSYKREYQRDERAEQRSMRRWLPRSRSLRLGRRGRRRQDRR